MSDERPAGGPLPHIVTPNNDSLNAPIIREDILVALRKSKGDKALGLDDIPIEAITSEQSMELLAQMFNRCLSNSIVPDVWRRGIINPIPKSSTADPRVPLNYRGITLSSHMYKLYCSVLNNRITSFVESNNLLHDEQNGFRSDRSCIDHLSSLTSIIDTRKNVNYLRLLAM